MLQPSFHRQFKKDLDRMVKRGKDSEKVKEVIIILVNQQELAGKYRDHKLSGNYSGRRECHIEPDWLLIYKISEDSIIFERTGTHSDLFR